MTVGIPLDNRMTCGGRVSWIWAVPRIITGGRRECLRRWGRGELCVQRGQFEQSSMQRRHSSESLSLIF